MIYRLEGCALERWRDVIGFEGFYQVSDLGRVRSVDRVVPHGKGGVAKMVGKVLRFNPLSKGGYFLVGLNNNGKRKCVLVHRLVLAAWVGPCSEGCEARHGPNGVADNSVDNLSYGTHSENTLDKRRDGTNGGRKVVRSDGVEFASMSQAAEESNCHAANICRTCGGRSETAGGFGWRYADEE